MGAHDCSYPVGGEPEAIVTSMASQWKGGGDGFHYTIIARFADGNVHTADGWMSGAEGVETIVGACEHGYSPTTAIAMRMEEVELDVFDEMVQSLLKQGVAPSVVLAVVVSFRAEKR